MITDVNPFVYSRPIAPDQIVDRDEETQLLLKNAVGGHYVRLYAPRKYGKTSLLRRALADGERQEGLVPVLVDLYGVVSLADVAVRFERAYARELTARSAAGSRSSCRGPASGSRSAPSGSAQGCSSSRRPTRCRRCTRCSTCRCGSRSGAASARCIALDEFQDVRKVPDLDGILRSHIQFQGDVASYVFAGSEPGLMKQLFEHKEAPLYGSAVPVRLGRLRDEDLAAYVAERFRETGRGVGEALNPLLASAKGHPQRAMLLAHRLWEEVEPKGVATLEEWERAHAAALAELQPEFEAQWRGSRRPPSRRRCARSSPATARRTGPRVLERLALSKTSAQKALAAAERQRRDRGGGAQAGDRRPALRGVDRGAGLVEQGALEPCDRLALDARVPFQPAVVCKRGAQLDCEHARPQQLCVVQRPVRVENGGSPVGRHEAPQQRQVDRRIGAADVAPVDHAARGMAIDQQVAEVQVAVHEYRWLRRREPLALGEEVLDARRGLPDAEALDLGQLLPCQRRAPVHVRPPVGVERQCHVELDGVQLAQEPRELESDLDARLVVEPSVARLGSRQQVAAEERPREVVVRLADEHRHRHGQRQERRELRQHGELPLDPRDRDGAMRDPERVALVDDPDAVVPALGELARGARLQLRELPQQPPHDGLVDVDLG